MADVIPFPKIGQDVTEQRARAIIAELREQLALEEGSHALTPTYRLEVALLYVAYLERMLGREPSSSGPEAA